MKTIALFNNKGGVGKTTLVYHLPFAFERMGRRVLVADFDPQSNLTALCLDEERLETLWSVEESKRATVAGVVFPIKEELGGQREVEIEAVSRRIGLVVGDLALAGFEAKLAEAWPRCLEGVAPPFRAMSALHVAVQQAGEKWGADVALIDVGPNLGALNRAALLAAQWIVTPLNADLFSIQGLRNLGPTLSSWRAAWQQRVQRAPAPVQATLPTGAMTPAGYVVCQPAAHATRLASFERWAVRVPAEYAAVVGAPATGIQRFADDPWCLGVVKNYRSLMPLAHEARKPIFALTGADGALGAHAAAARTAGVDFVALAEAIDAHTSRHS